jgi:hypothetical protein
MIEREKFLTRWSRKKRQAVDESAPSEPQQAETRKEPNIALPGARTEAEKPFDLQDLPSIESITAQTDIRGFLQPGIPPDLKREALRRAWVSDPGIRDFVGLAENSGDFNDPTAIPGFGAIKATEVARLMVGYVLTPPEANEVADTTESAMDQRDRQAEGTTESHAEATVIDEGEASTAATESHAVLQNEGTKSESSES